jgi:hypothetical protein
MFLFVQRPLCQDSCTSDAGHTGGTPAPYGGKIHKRCLSDTRCPDQPEAVVVVPVLGPIPVAICRTTVLGVVVPTTAPKDPVIGSIVLYHPNILCRNLVLFACEMCATIACTLSANLASVITPLR